MYVARTVNADLYTVIRGGDYISSTPARAQRACDPSPARTPVDDRVWWCPCGADRALL